MNELQNFNFSGQDVRIITINDEPWFVGKDVADILGYSNSRKALSDHVDDEDKGVTKSDTLGGNLFKLKDIVSSLPRLPVRPFILSSIVLLYFLMV